MSHNHFELSISELETIVKELEQGELTLENSLVQFEKGVGLVRKCQDILTKAEQKIETLTKETICDNEPTDD